jgi:hypothetical protein
MAEGLMAEALYAKGALYTSVCRRSLWRVCFSATDDGGNTRREHAGARNFAERSRNRVTIHRCAATERGGTPVPIGCAFVGPCVYARLCLGEPSTSEFRFRPKVVVTKGRGWRTQGHRFARKTDRSGDENAFRLVANREERGTKRSRRFTLRGSRSPFHCLSLLSLSLALSYRTRGQTKHSRA